MQAVIPHAPQVLVPPQSLPPSSPFCTPSMQVGAAHVPVVMPAAIVQILSAQSLFCVQALVSGQAGQFAPPHSVFVAGATGTTPLPVSPWSRTPSMQVGASQSFVVPSACVMHAPLVQSLFAAQPKPSAQVKPGAQLPPQS